MTVVLSCVIDNHPKFVMQAWNLVCSLMQTGDWPAPDVQLLIHHTPDVPAARLRLFQTLGATLVPVKPFGPGPAAYCNKLRQLETPPLREADCVLLLDTDVVATRSLRPLMASQQPRGRIVDFANPPAGIWEAALAGTDLTRADLPDGQPAFEPEAWTPASNFNGGLYVLPRAAVAALAPLWPKWATHFLTRADTLGRYAHHADQMGFAAALVESGLAAQPLEAGQNFPTHLSPAHYASVPPCRIDLLHYHGHMDHHGLPRPVGVDWIDAEIAAARKALQTARRSAFDNGIFWDFRYHHDPELGSGVGSRGEVLAYKQRRLAPYLHLFRDGPILDIGCGDIETTRPFPLTDYLGLDVSAEAVALGRQKRPDWRFACEDIATRLDGSARLTLCLDVLIHQGDAASFDHLVRHMTRVASEAVIVSGYPEVEDQDGIVFSHHALAEQLRAQPGVAQVTEIGRYRGLVLLLAEKTRPAPANPSDIGLPALAWGIANCPTPDLLLDLVRLSREKLSFFPQTIIRTVEYPWIASRLAGVPGQRVLDIGAGVCALPLWLADQQADVTTIDRHDMIRSLDGRMGWNEWGFLDYGLLDDRITSINDDVAGFAPAERFDTIYSVSVIEHMPAALRRRIIARLPDLMRPEGRLLLTLDLVPGGDDLWPLSEGVVVDPADPHGTLDSVIDELGAAGFVLTDLTRMRAIPGSRTDLAMMNLRLEAEPYT